MGGGGRHRRRRDHLPRRRAAREGAQGPDLSSKGAQSLPSPPAGGAVNSAVSRGERAGTHATRGGGAVGHASPEHPAPLYSTPPHPPIPHPLGPALSPSSPRTE